MTSRERILAAFNHQQTDRVPIDFGAHRSSGISAIAYARLKKSLGISTGNIYVYDMVQQLAIIETEVLDIIGADVIEMGRGFMLDDCDWKDWVLPDRTPCKIPAYVNVEKRGNDSYLVSDSGIDLALQKENCLYFEQIYWPWLEKNPEQQDFSNLSGLLDNMWSGVPTPGAHIPLTAEGCKQLAAGAKKLRQSSERAILGIFGGNMFEIPQFLYRIDNYLLYLALYPEACERFAEALGNFHLNNLEKWLGAVGEHIDVILFGDDLGGQNGPLISPEMYRRYFKPWHAKMFKRVKELAPHLHINLHSCGGIEPLLPDLIDTGLDSVNPVQITCGGMEPEHLKAKYGDKFTFWGGGCDTQHILPAATPAQVKQHVRQLIDIWQPNGGFVFQQVHNILADVPAQNILAMFEAIREA